MFHKWSTSPKYLVSFPWANGIYLDLSLFECVFYILRAGDILVSFNGQLDTAI